MQFQLEGLSWTGRRHVIAQEPNHDSFDFGTTDGGLVWAVVSDGCSSSKYPRQGSQDVIEAVKTILSTRTEPYTDPRQFEHLLLQELNRHKYPCPLDYAATAVVLQVHEGKVYVHFFGDGSLLVQNCDGVYREISLNYSRNAPRFLHYFVRSSNGFAECDELSGPEWSRFCYPPQVAERFDIEYGQFVDKRKTEPFPIGSPLGVVIDLVADDVWNLAICSDGVTDPAESLGSAILESGLGFGLTAFVGALKDAKGFVMPADDATFVNLHVTE